MSIPQTVEAGSTVFPLAAALATRTLTGQQGSDPPIPVGTASISPGRDCATEGHLSELFLSGGNGYSQPFHLCRYIRATPLQHDLENCRGGGIAAGALEFP
jgi:hypothetical protein